MSVNSRSLSVFSDAEQVNSQCVHHRLFLWGSQKDLRGVCAAQTVRVTRLLSVSTCWAVMLSAWLSVAHSRAWKYRLKLMADWRYRLAAPHTPDTFISRYLRPGRVSKSRAVLQTHRAGQEWVTDSEHGVVVAARAAATCRSPAGGPGWWPG